MSFTFEAKNIRLDIRDFLSALRGLKLRLPEYEVNMFYQADEKLLKEWTKKVREIEEKASMSNRLTVDEHKFLLFMEIIRQDMNYHSNDLYYKAVWC